MAEQSHRRRLGRPSLGPRKQLNINVKPELKDCAAARAKAKGMTLNDYVAALIAGDIQRPELASTAVQEVLPIPA